MPKQKTPELCQITIIDDFFSPILETIRSVTVRDIITKFEHDRGGAITNFDRVRDGVLGEHAGPEWYDGLTYETMAGMADLLAQSYDPMIDLILDNYAARIAAAAILDDDGYVNTYTQTMEPTHRFGENGGFLRGQHDVYNAGCLVEAAVCHYRATGKTSLMDTAVRFAVYLYHLMGKPPKKNIVPAHSQPEEAMIFLYRLFQEDASIRDRYPKAENGTIFKELAEFWLENRGVHAGMPDWDNWTHQECVDYIRTCQYGEDRPTWGAYAQDHIPVLEQKKIVGHAVRAVLLFAGLAAAAYENGRTDYIKTVRRIWENMANKRMHITGGVGALYQDEKFGSDYFLPHDAYLETCAAVGSVFFSHNMYLLTGEAKYMELAETTLFNGVLAGIAMDGKHYSYINPLISDGSLHRWEWHVCPCCPPMDLKLYGRLPRMIYSYTEDSVSVNLYISSETEFPLDGDKGWKIRQFSELPWAGNVSIISKNDSGMPVTLRIRIPTWCYNEYTLLVNGEKWAGVTENGYACMTRAFLKNDVIMLTFYMPILLGQANEKVKQCSGQVVLKRGPMLYCLEATDNPQGLEIIISQDIRVSTRLEPELLGGIVCLDGMDTQGHAFTAIPFYRWDNRNPGAMRVWLDAKSVPVLKDSETLYRFIPINKST